MMEIIQHSNALLIKVKSGSIDEIVIHDYVEKYFQNTLKNDQSIVIFFRDKSELPSRKIFLHWLYSAYSRSRSQQFPELKESLLKNSHLPIKIRFVGKTDLEHTITITVNVITVQSINLTFAPETVTYVHNFLRNYFKDQISFYKQENNQYHIMINDALSRDRLLQLLRRKLILHYHVRFHYDLNDIKKVLGFQHQRDTQVPEHNSRLLKAYSIFKATPDDPLEEIRKKYKKLLHYYHPDRVYDQHESIIKEHTSKFQLIRDAYDSIKKDKENRYLTAS